MRRRAVAVPMVMQTNSGESGAACLGMLLAYYGLWISLGQLREDCGVGVKYQSSKICCKWRSVAE